MSLLNNLVILKRLVPVKIFTRCEFGLTAGDNMDCIYCDRCRYQIKPFSPQPAAKYSAGRYLLILVLLFGIFISALYIDKFLDTIPVLTESSPASTSSIGRSTSLTPGRPRDVDIQRIRTMIEEKKLSGHEAGFYEKNQ